MTKINEMITTMAEAIKEYDITIGHLHKAVHELLKEIEGKKIRLAALKFDRAQVYNAWYTLAKKAKEEQDERLNTTT